MNVEKYRAAEQPDTGGHHQKSAHSHRVNFGQVVRNVSAGYVNKRLCANTFAILTQNMTCFASCTHWARGREHRGCVGSLSQTSDVCRLWIHYIQSKWRIQHKRNIQIKPSERTRRSPVSNDVMIFWEWFQSTDHHKLFFFFCKTTHFHRMSHNSQGWVGSHLCNLLQWFGWKPVGN